MKLSRKKSIRLAFVASKLALSIDQNERMALLTELLDELGIDDAAQRLAAFDDMTDADQVDQLAQMWGAA